jgi:hypothetical protein
MAGYIRALDAKLAAIAQAKTQQDKTMFFTLFGGITALCTVWTIGMGYGCIHALVDGRGSDAIAFGVFTALGILPTGAFGRLTWHGWKAVRANQAEVTAAPTVDLGKGVQ